MESIRYGRSGKMSPAPLVQVQVGKKALTLKPCSKRSQKPVFQFLDQESGQTQDWYEATELVSLGGCLTPQVMEFPSVAKESFLWQILEMDVPKKYYLSRKACLGILRRAKKRGREIPHPLKVALKNQVMETRYDIDAASPSYRIFLQPDTTCLTPWDLQSERVHPEGGLAPAIAGIDRGGGRRPAGNVFCKQRNTVNAIEHPASSCRIPHILHPEIAGTICASGAGLYRPAGMGSELDLCVVEAVTTHHEHVCEFRTGEEENTQSTEDNENKSMPPRATESRFIAAGFNGWRSVTGTLEYAEERAPCISATMPPDVIVLSGQRRFGISTERKYLSPGFNGEESGIPYDGKYEYIVRRFTPKECELLMGFPPFWTEYGVSRAGHSNKVSLKKVSDSRRYRMMGNSLAIPCTEFVLGGIVLQESRRKGS